MTALPGTPVRPAHAPPQPSRKPRRCWVWALLLGLGAAVAGAQSAPGPAGQAPDLGALRKAAAHRFLARRGLGGAAPEAGARLGSLAQARQQAAELNAQQPTPAVSSSTWQSLGPARITTAAYGPITGRISSIAVDPTDSSGNTVYVGTTGGGVWKSSNAAGTASSVVFTPLTDTTSAFSATTPSLSIGAVSVQPANRNVILAGTGDTNDALDSYFGVGILRSTDGGNTWTLIPTSQDGFNGGLANYTFVGEGFSGFAWSGTNTNLVVAAVSESVEGELVNAGTTAYQRGGMYYSTNAGATWFLATLEDSSSAIIQSSTTTSSAPGNPATSVVWNPVRQRFYAAIRYHGYYESTDGQTWTRLANQPGTTLTTSACPANPGKIGSSGCPIFRGEIAAQPFTGDLFTLTTDSNNLDQGLYQDVCSTTGTQATSCTSSTVLFGTRINSAPLENGNGDTTIADADYNLTLAAVHSGQDTLLLAGTEDLFRCSLANSCTWRNTTNVNTCAAAMVAPAQHATDATFGVNGLVFFGNDGGLWRTTDDVAQTGAVCASTDAAHFQNLNTAIGSLSEVEHFAVSQSSATDVLAGVGAFGSAATATGSGAWPQMLTGEGSYMAIDPTNANLWYADADGGVGIYRCTAGTNCTSSTWGSSPVVGYAQDEDDADYFQDPAPWILDPESSSNILLGTCRVWRGPANNPSGWSSSSLLSPMLDGYQRSNCDGNAQLRSIAAGLTAASGTEQIYVGMAGLNDGGGTVPGHLFTSLVSAASGQTAWTDLYSSTVANSSNQPQMNPAGFPISSIAVDPHDTTGKTVYITLQGFSGNGVSQGLLYTSSNGGSTWYNITSNLPNAPANSVVVDPNVAGYVYVATDTGVYYTSNVVSCQNTSNNCWATYGSGLPRAPVTELKVYNGSGGGVLEAATYGRGIWALGLATGASTGTLTPATYSFGNQQVSTTSSAATFTVQNTGTTTMSIAQVAVTGDYAETTTCGTTLAANSSCTVSVTFTPTTTGDRPGTLTVYANVTGGQLQSTLDGTGVAAGALAVSPGSLTFGAALVGSTSQPQTVTLQNTGGSAVQLGTPSITGNFAYTNGCGSTLAPNSSCTVAVTFTPAAAGTLTGTLTLPSNLPSSPATVALSGTGTAAAGITFSPSPVNFPGSTAVNNTSAAQLVTATNSGGVSTTLGTPRASGDFAVSSSTCGSSLAAAASCNISVTFTPSATGTRNGVLTLPAPNVSGGSATDALSGNGVQPAAITFTPSTLTFPGTAVGATSSPMSVTLTSSGGVAVQINSISVSGEYALVANNCPGTLNPNATCTVQVNFSPTTAGDRKGTLTVSGNVSSGTAIVPLDGNGLSAPALTGSPSPLSFPATAQGATSSAQSVTVTNNGQATAQLGASSITGDFAIASNTCGSSLAGDASCTVAVTFTPTQTGTRTGQLVVPVTNASGANATVNLSGNGVPVPTVTLTPNPAAFGSVTQGGASPAVTITAANGGQVAVQLGSPTLTGDYQLSGSTCGTTLAASASCTLSVVFHPTATGNRAGTLTLPGSMSGGSASDTLGGTGTTPGNLTLQPSSMSFPGQATNTTSSQQAATVTNTGGSAAGVGVPSITGDFQIAANGCGATLAAGASCTLQITFTPTATGSRTGQVSVTDTDSGNTLVMPLSGPGLAPAALALSPATANFGTLAVGATSNPATFTLSNSGQVAANLQTPGVTGTGFQLKSNTCTTSLAGGASCSLTVTFTPASTGPFSGTLSVASSSSGTSTATLAGTGAAPPSLTLSPSSLSFASTVQGGTSAAQTVTARNSGGVPVTLGTPTVTSGYTLANNCGATLNAGATCTLGVTFTPTTAGDDPGTLSFPGQFASSPATAALDGTGLAPGSLTLAPSSLSFGSVIQGQTSPAQAITVTNPGGVAVTFGSIAANGSFSVAAQGTTCSGSLGPGKSCTVAVTFTPPGVAAYSGVLTIAGNIQGNTVTASLSGNGVTPGALSLSPTSLSFATTATGSTSAAQTLTLTNSGGAAVPLASPALAGDFELANTTCPATLAGQASCTYSVVFHPTTTGLRSGSLTASSSGTGTNQHATATLAGTGAAPASLSFAPAALAFGSVQLGQSAPAQKTTLTNTGGLPASLNTPVLTGDYALASNTCGASLAAGASCSLAVTFTPSALGDRPGSLTVNAQGSGASASVALDGTGIPVPSLVLTPTSLSFAATDVGSTSAVQNINVANVGTVTVALQAPTVTGPFAITNNTCGTTLAPQYSCTVSVVFKPVTGGAASGVFTIASASETHTAQLTGTGLTSATDTLSPTSLSFGAQAIGTVSGSQPVTLTNSGGAALTQIAATVQGPFTVVNNCGSQLGGGLSCTFAVSYAPTATGQQTGTLTVSDINRSQTVTLTGEGALPPNAVASPLSIDFGGYAVNGVSPAQTVTVSNNGQSPMDAVAATVSSTSFTLVANTCGSTLGVGASCTLSVAFAPQTIGTANGTLSVSSPSLTAPLTVSLTGSGEDFTLSVTGYTGATIVTGQTANYTLQVTPVGASLGTVSMSCSGAPLNATCSFNPVSSTVGHGVSASFALAVATGVKTSSSLRAPGGGSGSRPWELLSSALAACLLLPLGLRRPARRTFFAALVACALVLMPTACGVHASGPGGPSKTNAGGDTPAGVYTITVTASFPGATRTTTVSLIVE